ncbi:MAG TPA: c-type cytochrome [Methylophilaceae bacterium]|nr:c-type cytochrome [Methylophilaceae bacterium]
MKPRCLYKRRATAPLTVLLAPFVFMAAQAAADSSPPDIQALHIRTLAASCAACHGTNGNSVGGNSIGGTPVLAGLSPMHFVSQMLAFRSGERASTVMHRHAKGLTEEEIRQLANYFSAQPRIPAAIPKSQEFSAK